MTDPDEGLTALWIGIAYLIAVVVVLTAVVTLS